MSVAVAALLPALQPAGFRSGTTDYTATALDTRPLLRSLGIKLARLVATLPKVDAEIKEAA